MRVCVSESVSECCSLLACSGGKDSCYNAMQCVAAGHTLAALANLRPEDKGQLLATWVAV